ncbi:glycosyltransferase family 9 protein [Pararhodospirillum oryzae]|uniref:Uncharacterized protein n=1 Tax=Pararhodospirillum oryzae TaxID=478448 RepID=A0A512HAJ4_9PROT|nr:tetratricopeptide repeat protein [Pararhodospirillum oryzae]GEO82462.1 hypothetical protein ROR02_25930 [Pararhodospirillum oryzae]
MDTPDAAVQALVAVREQPARVVQVMTEAVARHPDNPVVLMAASITALSTGHHAHAVPWLRRIVHQAPDLPEARHTLVQALLVVHDVEGALAALDDGPAGTPADPRLAPLRVVVLARLGRMAEALALAEALVDRAAAGFDDPGLWHNLGLLRAQVGLLKPARDALRRALELDPGNTNTRVSLAHALLAGGAWAEGFATYEARLSLPGWARPHPLPGRRWTGQPLAGQSLLIAAEQGLGDGLQFLRYIPPLRRLFSPARVIVETHAPLARLAARVPGVDQVAVFSPGDPPPAADWHVPLASLALTVAGGDPLGGSLPLLPCPVAPRGPERKDRRIGLALRSSARPDLQRDPPPDAWAPLARVAGVRWVSVLPADASAPPPPFPLEEPVAAGADLADTATVLAGLDLVISVDTAAAHLAGTLGCPLWVLLGPRPDWRWGWGDVSPWYPGARLLRGAACGWPGLMARVASLLEEDDIPCPDNAPIARDSLPDRGV